jgi:hypothetical protein
MAGVGKNLVPIAHVPEFDGVIAAGGGEPGSVRAESQGDDFMGVPQAHIAQDAAHVVRQLGRLIGELPTRLAKRLGGLKESARFQSRRPAFGDFLRLVHQQGGKPLGRPVFECQVAFLPVFSGQLLDLVRGGYLGFLGDQGPPSQENQA